MQSGNGEIPGSVDDYTTWRRLIHFLLDSGVTVRHFGFGRHAVTLNQPPLVTSKLPHVDLRFGDSLFADASGYVFPIDL